MSFRNSSLLPSWTTTIFSFVLATISLVLATALALPALGNQPAKRRRIRIACLGNSIQYYNDCPRLLERMFAEEGWYMEQDSCLRGGSTTISLWEKGNGMQTKFATPNGQLPSGSFDIGAPTVKSLLEDETFDVCIINDHTQSPVRKASREATVKMLKAEYAPLLLKSNIQPVFLQTAAYKFPEMRGTEDLGDFDHYTQLLVEGYRVYKQQLDECFQGRQLQTRIAPVGMAFSKLYHTNRSLWEQLYHVDNFHPSPHGTLLQAYILYLTLTEGEAPPANYDETWWNRARVMQPAGEEPLPRPTVEESKVLRDVAIQVFQEQT